MADELTLSIEKLIYGGDGLAHTEDNTVFVPYVLPGEQVTAAVRTRKKKLLHAKLVEVKQASGGANYSQVRTFRGVRRMPLPAH